MQQFGVQMPHRPIPMEHFPRPLCTVSPNKINKLLCETVLEQGMVSTPPENGEIRLLWWVQRLGSSAKRQHHRHFWQEAFAGLRRIVYIAPTTTGHGQEARLAGSLRSVWDINRLVNWQLLVMLITQLVRAWEQMKIKFPSPTCTWNPRSQVWVKVLHSTWIQ